MSKRGFSYNYLDNLKRDQYVTAPENKLLEMEKICLFLFCIISSTSVVHALVCVCPLKETYYVYPQPNYAVAVSPIRRHECLKASVAHDGWYTVTVDKMVGFVHESEIAVKDNCNHLQERKRFLFFDWMIKGMKGMAEGMAAGMTGMANMMGVGWTSAKTMACMSSCSSCDCNGPCFEGKICSPCKDLICPETGNFMTHEDPCKSSPCLNGGECLKTERGYQCYCKRQNSTVYLGNRCQAPLVLNNTHDQQSTTTSPTTETTTTPLPTVTHHVTQLLETTTMMDACSSSPCLNGGLCLNKGLRYECYCKSFPRGGFLYTGMRCELAINLNKPKATETPWLKIPG